jgi:hypothetical protein
LDGLTKDGEEFFSEEDEESDYGEEGEDDLYDLDEDEIEELRRKGVDPAKYFNGDDQFVDGEEGEDEQEYGEEEPFSD